MSYDKYQLKARQIVGDWRYKCPLMQLSAEHYEALTGAISNAIAEAAWEATERALEIVEKM